MENKIKEQDESQKQNEIEKKILENQNSKMEEECKISAI